MSRLSAGTAALARRYRIWLWEDGAARGLLRIVGGVTVLGFTGGVCLAAPVLLVPVAVGLLLSAWAVGRAPEGEDEGEDEPEDYTPTEFLTHLHGLLAGTDRIHLAQIAADLYDDPAATGQVRDLCAAAGVSITPSVRIKGRTPTVSTGLYRKHLPPLPEGVGGGDVAAVIAGQDELQLQLQASREGFVTVPDPDGNPVRYEVRWVGSPARQSA